MRKTRNSSVLSTLLMAAMMSSDAMSNEKREPQRTVWDRLFMPPFTPPKNVPFHKEEGVLKMIADYKLIKKGESKKGIIKQTRITSKIDNWIKEGKLDKSLKEMEK